VKIGIGVGVRVSGEEVDPAQFLDGVYDLLGRRAIDATRFKKLVLFSAEDAMTLADLAGPVAEWWQSFKPSTRGDVVLTMVGPGGKTELNYCLPEHAVENVRHLIVTECGPRYERGQAPGVIRRAAAQVLRRVRAGFVASEVNIGTAEGCLVVAVAGRDLDDSPRSIEFQTADPADPYHDGEDDAGYCLVNEQHSPVFRALEGLSLAGDQLRLKLTPAAAKVWRMRSTTLTIKLQLAAEDIHRLRAGLRQIFDMSSADSPKDLHL
jgi:hypothetical protein